MTCGEEDVAWDDLVRDTLGPEGATYEMCAKESARIFGSDYPHLLRAVAAPHDFRVYSPSDVQWKHRQCCSVLALSTAPERRAVANDILCQMYHADTDVVRTFGDVVFRSSAPYQHLADASWRAIQRDEVAPEGTVYGMCKENRSDGAVYRHNVLVARNVYRAYSDAEICWKHRLCCAVLAYSSHQRARGAANALLDQMYHIRALLPLLPLA